VTAADRRATGPAASVTLRVAVPEDASAIETVRVAAWRDAYADLLPAGYLAGMSASERAPRQARRLATPAPRQQTLIATVAGLVAGFAASGPSREQPAPTMGELYAIYVDPARQGRGVGAALHAAVLDRLCEVGFTTATLRVFEGNAPARAFYERRGWRFDVAAELYEPAPGIAVPELRYARAL
jgi:GNAT superfamily N-acetyltransferase